MCETQVDPGMIPSSRMHELMWREPKRNRRKTQVKTTNKRIEAAAKAMARVFSNGGDPNAPAIRWNGSQMEPQEFPAWHDYKDEALVVVAAIDAASSEDK